MPYIYSGSRDQPAQQSAQGVQNLHFLIQVKMLITVKILKFGTPQTIAIIVLKIEKFDVTLH